MSLKSGQLELPTALAGIRPVQVKGSKWKRHVTAVLLIAAAASILVPMITRGGDAIAQARTGTGTGTTTKSGSQIHACNQLPPLSPSGPPASFESDSIFRFAALGRLSGAVQIQTVSFDNMTNVPPQNGGDEIHAQFKVFHNYLEAVFPLVHKNLKKTVINEYSLLFTWEGKNKDDKPLVLMAHQDVVPVLPETLNQWTHPPFSGFIDEENGRLWGRGAGDTKATLFGTLEAVEQLLKSGFVPNRSVYLAYGHDEEISGHQGAKRIAQYLENDLNLKGKLGLLIDEGPGFDVRDDVHLAAVGTGEKGYVDVSVTVETKGGHSSVPPKHTGIGLSALLIAELESNPYPISLSDNNPLLGATKCYAQHSKHADPSIQKALDHLNNGGREKLAKLLASTNEVFESLLGTTQAVDVINGGLKVNALPEKVTTVINHRIAVDSSLKGTQDHIYSVLKKVVKNYALNLTVVDFTSLNGNDVAYEIGVAHAIGKVTVEPAFPGLEPSPTSPSNGDKDLGWNVLEGTIHHVYDKSKGGETGSVVVGPSIMPGNTDTRHYWGLGKSIYRFAPIDGANAHTVDEYVVIDGYIQAIRFYHELIRNWSEA
ncbi:UNVERIFIED_CONTAM: hypothetical protein HDU68_008473 [Siphonaria sp. JEL0065]|nr:hypothetical protein HDU68_008473 [Siphonaria sp. JEL0065]